MVYIRNKQVKGINYSYLVRSLLDKEKKSSKQDTIKYLGRTETITLVDSREELILLSGNRLGNIQGYTNYEVSTLAGKVIDQDYHIYILSNLHREIFNAVLAHELLHVYLFQNQLDLA